MGYMKDYIIEKAELLTKKTGIDFDDCMKLITEIDEYIELNLFDHGIVLNQRELLYVIPNMVKCGINDFHIEELSDDDKNAIKVKFKNMRYCDITYIATEEQDEDWELKPKRNTVF